MSRGRRAVGADTAWGGGVGSRLRSVRIRCRATRDKCQLAAIRPSEDSEADIHTSLPQQHSSLCSPKAAAMPVSATGDRVKSSTTDPGGFGHFAQPFFCTAGVVLLWTAEALAPVQSKTPVSQVVRGRDNDVSDISTEFKLQPVHTGYVQHSVPAARKYSVSVTCLAARAKSTPIDFEQ